MFLGKRLITIKIPILSQLIYIVKAIPFKILKSWGGLNVVGGRGGIVLQHINAY